MFGKLLIFIEKETFPINCISLQVNQAILSLFAYNGHLRIEKALLFPLDSLLYVHGFLKRVMHVLINDFLGLKNLFQLSV